MVEQNRLQAHEEELSEAYTAFFSNCNGDNFMFVLVQLTWIFKITSLCIINALLSGVDLEKIVLGGGGGGVGWNWMCIPTNTSY